MESFFQEEGYDTKMPESLEIMTSNTDARNQDAPHFFGNRSKLSPITRDMYAEANRQSKKCRAWKLEQDQSRDIESESLSNSKKKVGTKKVENFTTNPCRLIIKMLLNNFSLHQTTAAIKF